MSFNRWGSIVDGVDPVNTTETSISEIRSDGVSIYDAIPDIGDLEFNYDFSESADTTSVPDTTGNKTDLTTGDFSFSSKNGVQVASFSGTDTEVSGAFGTNVTTPFHVFWVAKSDTTTGSNYLWSYESAGWHVQGTEWSWFDRTNSFDFGTSDTEWHVFDMLVESNNFVFAVDGTVIIPSQSDPSSSNPDMSEFVIGDFSGGDNDWEGDVGLLLAYGQDKTAKRSDIANALGSIYGVSLN